MNAKKFSLSAIAAGLLGLASLSANAAPFVATADIYGGASSYAGSDQSLGYVGDGGFDAFDGFGYYPFGLPAGVTLQRQVQLLAGINTYRWVDTFTNSTNTALSGQARFYGNLGSDGGEAVTTNTGFLKVSHENWSGQTYDPVLALINGNNAWALANTSAAITPNDYNDYITLNLAAGQSISVAHFAILVRPDDISSTYDPTASVASATALGQALIADPSTYWTGLSTNQVSLIANFDSVRNAVPEPTSLALLGLGVAGLLGARRRKQS